jgi:methyl-accepting chemotaxis protein
VDKYLLSDREVAKKIISKSNPGMSNGQLNFMLYGSETIPKLNVARVGGGLAGTLDTIPTPKGLTAPGTAIPSIGSSSGQTFVDFSNPETAVKTLSSQGFSGGIIGGSPRAPFESELLRRLRQELLEDEASGLNTVDLKKEIERLEAEAASAPGQDLIDSVGQIRDYVSGGKSVLQARGSGMTKDLAIKSAEFVLRYMNSSNRPVTRSYTFISNRRGLGSSGMPWEAIVVYALDAGTDTGAPPVPTINVPGLGDQEAMEQAALAEDFAEIAKKQAEARLGGYSPYPLDKDSPIIEGAKKKKMEVREAIANFVSKQKEMLNDLIASLSIVVSSIPAMGILITTPPFNVPAALTLINLVFQSINKLVGSIVNLIAILEKVKGLSTYFGDKAYREVARVITPVVEFLTKLIDPIGALKKFIEKIIEQIKKLFNGDNCKKHRRRLNRDLRRKKRDLAKEMDEEEKKDLQDEVDQLNERLKDLEKNCKKTSVEQDTESINQLLKETNEMSTQIVDDITETLVYDVTLPNGEVLTGISEDALQDLKLRYTVLVVDDDGTSGIYRTPSSEPAF